MPKQGQQNITNDMASSTFPENNFLSKCLSNSVIRRGNRIIWG